MSPFQGLVASAVAISCKQNFLPHSLTALTLAHAPPLTTPPSDLWPSQRDTVPSQARTISPFPGP